MATEKPRFSITVSNEMYELINEYQHENRLSTQTKAIAAIMEKGIQAMQLNKKSPAAPISGEAERMGRRYDALDADGQAVVDAVMEYAERRSTAKVTPIPEQKTIPLLGDRFAAGTGDPDLGVAWEDYDIPADSKAEFAIHINGDSMEPYLPDGSIALAVKETPRQGDVAALIVDGEFLVKQICNDHVGNLYLFALNRDRKDADRTLWARDEHSVTCLGTIIMRPVPLP